MKDTVLVILAGGQGKRLASVFDAPKVLLPFGDKTLIEWTLDAFAACGLREAAIVVGWKADTVQDRLGREYNGVHLHYWRNLQYETTGAGYGLSLATSQWAGRACVIMEGDQLLHPWLIRDFAEGPNDCIPVKVGPTELGEETVVVGRKGKVDRLVWPAWQVKAGEKVVGEAIVMIKLSAKSSLQLSYHLDGGEIIAPLNHLGLSYMETAYPWIEIDTPADLERAREIHRRIVESL